MKKLSKITIFAIGFFASSLGWSQSIPIDQGKTVRSRLKDILKGTEIEALNYTNFNGLIEVVTPGGIFYTNRDGAFLIEGSLINVDGKINETQNRWQKLGAFEFSNLPFQDAIKLVNGNGKRTVVTFEDPNCGYCKKLAPELQKLSNVTIYTFVVPILSADSEVKARAVWCSKDRNIAWREAISAQTKETRLEKNCDSPNVRNVALYRKMHLSGTPAIIFQDNTRMAGYQTAQAIDKKLGVE